MLVLSRVSVNGQDVAAGRIVAPILQSAHRHGSLLSPDHPIAKMSRILLEQARQQGIQVVYALPEQAWLLWFRMAERFGLPRFATAVFPHYRISIEYAAMELSRRQPADEVHEVETFGDQYVALWQRSERDLPIRCGVVRSPEWLQFASRRFQILEVRNRHSQELIGYSSVHRSQCVITDMLAANRFDQECVLSSTLAWFVHTHQSDPGATGLNHLNILATRQTEESIIAVGFTRQSDGYAFACCASHEHLHGEAVAPERWYLMLGD
jgi:hypothetical protein